MNSTSRAVIPSRTQNVALSLLVAAGVLGGPAWAQQPHSADHFGLVFGEPDFLLDLGSKWGRSDFTWSGIERKPGEFDFASLIERVDGYLKKGVTLLPILDYAPAWDPNTAPNDAQTLDLWARYVERTLSTFKGKIRYWQVWNEPNLSGFWKPEPDPLAYTELLRRTYFAAKKVDPGIQIIGVNCSDIDLEFAERVFRYGGLKYCDILAFQPYRNPPEMGHFEEMAALRALMERYGADKPIWFTEMGGDTKHFPFKDAKDYFADRPCRRQCAFLVRYMTISMASGIDKVFWFAQAAEGSGLENVPDHRKRPVFNAYQYLIKTIDSFQSIRELAPHGANGVYAYLLRCPEKDVAIAWSVHGPQRVHLPQWQSAREMRDPLGQRITRETDGDLLLTGEPVYLLFDKVPETLRRQALLSFSKPQLWLEPGVTETIAVRLDANSEVPVRLAVRSPRHLQVKPQILELKPGQSANLAIAASRRARPARDFVTLALGDVSWNIEVNITPTLLWQYQEKGRGFLSPTALHEGPGASPLLVATFNSRELFCIAPDGQALWNYIAESPINAAAVTGNIMGDAKREIVTAAPGRQTVFALDSNGALLWRVRLPGDPLSKHEIQETGKPMDTIENPGWRWNQPVTADLTGDGLDEIVYADNLGCVTAISGEGTILWRTAISEKRCDQPVCVGDVFGNGHKEIVAVDEGGIVYCLSNTGTILWKTATGGAVKAIPVLLPAGGNEPATILVANQDEKLVRLSGDGRILWSTALGGTVDLGCGITVADLDGDTIPEIVVSTRNHEVLALNRSGQILWRVETGAQIRSVPAVGDVDGDGAPEILVGSADGLLYCLGADGTTKWTIKVGNRVDATPLLTDLNQDGVKDIVLPVRGGKVFAWSCVASPQRAPKRKAAAFR
jgi:outer membrane protein assembly factor BamB